MGRRARRKTGTRRAAAQPRGVSNAVGQALAEAAAALTFVEGRYALVGGLAVAARSDPRFTADVDFAVSVRDDAEATPKSEQMTMAAMCPVDG